GLTDVPSPDPAAMGTVVVAAHPQGKRVRPVDVEKAVRGGGSLEELAGAPELHPLEMRHDTRLRGKASMNETTPVTAPLRPATPFQRKSAPPPPPSVPPPPPSTPSVDPSGPTPGLPFWSPLAAALPFIDPSGPTPALPFAPPTAAVLPFIDPSAPTPAIPFAP